MGQFLCMLLMFQGDSGVVPGVWAALLEKLMWVRWEHAGLPVGDVALSFSGCNSG